MTRPNITPGDWFTEEKSPLVIKAECPETGWVYTVADCSRGSQSDEHQRADAQAIKALRTCLKALEYYERSVGAPHFVENGETARKALTEAGYTF